MPNLTSQMEAVCSKNFLSVSISPKLPPTRRSSAA